MRSLNPKYILLLLLLLKFGLTTEAQYQRKSSFRIGFLMEGTFSSLGQNGLNPSLTFGNDCHEIQIGPRIGFAGMGGNENAHTFVMDGGYRINYLNKTKLSLFGSLRLEYAYGLFEWIFDYEPGGLYPAGGVYLGEESFKARNERRSHTLGVYLGTGIEFRIMDNVYIIAEGLYGLLSQSTESTYYNHASEEIIVSGKSIRLINSSSLMASVGIGYRF